jgi:hypothetical protein
MKWDWTRVTGSRSDGPHNPNPTGTRRLNPGHTSEIQQPQRSPTKFAPVMSSHRRDAIAVIRPSSIPRLWRSKLKFVAATQCAMHYEDKDRLITCVRCHGDPGRDEERTAAENRSATSDCSSPGGVQLKLMAHTASPGECDTPRPDFKSRDPPTTAIHGGGAPRCFSLDVTDERRWPVFIGSPARISAGLEPWRSGRGLRCPDQRDSRAESAVVARSVARARRGRPTRQSGPTRKRQSGEERARVRLPGGALLSARVERLRAWSWAARGESVIGPDAEEPAQVRFLIFFFLFSFLISIPFIQLISILNSSLNPKFVANLSSFKCSMWT